MNKRQRSLISLLGTVFLLLVLNFWRQSSASVTTSSVQNSSSVSNTTVRASSTLPDGSVVLVVRVVDGDTIELETGEKVRYIGVNTPETVSPKKPVECFGKEASNKNKELVTGQKVQLVKDVSESDRYGRLLRYVYLPDGTFVNLKLVQEGFAYADTFPPDVKYSKLFVTAQKQAQMQKAGLWEKCQ